MKATNKTFKISASTNGYIASRDAVFNGKTNVTLADGLSYDDARAYLTSAAIGDYDSMNNVQRIENQDEFLAFYFSGLIADMSYFVGVTDEHYFLTHKKMLNILYLKKRERFENFTGAGIYAKGQIQASAILLDTENSYEFDSRYYGIIEETDENE